MKNTWILILSCMLGSAYQLSGQAVINLGKTNQVIDGFGGSSAWSGQLSSTVMDALYKNGPNQLGFTILRCRIDPNKAWTDESVNAKNAKARGATVFATPWSPPASMKSNNDVNNGGTLLTSQYGNYVNHLNQFIDLLGTNLDIISIQNEPDWAPNYESCTWTGAQFHDFVLNYAASLKRPVMFPESLGYNWALSDPTLNDPAAAKNVSYIGGHLYGAQPKSYTLALNLGKHVWMTEWYNDNMTAAGLMTYAKLILDCMYQNFNAYVYWWMDQSNGVISTTGTPNVNGYILAQFAKYVRPGYYRVDVTYNPQSGVNVVAFKGASKAVIVVVNSNTSAKTQAFTLQNGTVTSVTKTTTSFSKNLSNDGTITVTNGAFSTSLDAQSITTFVGDLGNVPQVHFTSPTATGAYTVGTPIDLTATATISTGTIANVKFYDGATLLATDNSSPYSYSWTNATAGKHVLKAIATDNLGNTAFDTVAIKVNVPQGPYNGIVHPIPGTIQAEEFDVGGNGVAYYDDSPGSATGVAYRSDEDVDIEVCTDVGGGYNLGYATSGEWLEYTVEVAATGSYRLDLRVACNGDGRTVSLNLDGTPIASNIAIPNTAGWQMWTTTTVDNVPLSMGQHILRFTIGATNYVNVNYMTFSSVITGLEEVEDASSLSFYPNPFEKNLVLRYPGAFEYKLFDLSGSQLLQGKASNQTKIGETLQGGTYMLQVTTPQGSRIEKVIKK